MFGREYQKLLGVLLRLGGADEPIEHIRANEHVSERERMPESPGLREGFPEPHPSLIDIAQRPQGHRELGEHHGVGVCRKSRAGGATRWLAKTMTLLQERARGNKVTKKVASRPLRSATLQLRHYIVASLANSLDLLSQQQRSLVLGSDHMKRVLSVDQRHNVLGPINLLGQSMRSGDGFAHIGRGIALRGSQC